MSESTQVTPEIEAEKPVVSEIPAEEVLYKDVETKPEEVPEQQKPEVVEPEKPVEETPVKEETPAPAVVEDFKLEISKESGLTENDALEVTALAKEAGLSKEVAQKLLDNRASQLKNVYEAQKTEYATKISEWKKELENDPEIGGVNFKTSILQANIILDKFASPKLRKDLDSTGLGNHPELVRFIARLGKEFSTNDTMVKGGNSYAAPARSIEDIMYPDKN